MALAGGGQTLLSAAAREALAETFPTARRSSHGHYRLKGIEEPIGIFELGTPGAAVLAAADVDKAYRVIRDGDLWRPVREVRHNLPAERDAFVGRNADLRALAHRLDAGARLITVLGPGGTGKTRLVRRYGWSWLGDWPGGVYFCDLSDARSLDGIPARWPSRSACRWARTIPACSSATPSPAAAAAWSSSTTSSRSSRTPPTPSVAGWTARSRRASSSPAASGSTCGARKSSARAAAA